MSRKYYWKHMALQKYIILTVAISLVGQLPSFAQASRYLQMGIDAFSQKPVYLDQESVKKIGSTSYQYTLSSESEEPETGKPGRFEEDIVVDCTQIGSIVHLGSRLYDGQGSLVKSDRFSRTQDLSNSRSMPYVNGNQTICSKLPK
jgi:hypothetical protein